MAKTLLITADDFGVEDVIDNGIRMCIHNIDCIDVIVTHRTSRERLKCLLEDYREQIEKKELLVGLHLTLTVGSPQLKAVKGNPHFEEDRKFLRFISKFPKKPKPVRREFRKNTNLGFVTKLDRLLRKHQGAAKREIEAQYDTFLSITKEVFDGGMKPAHISSHSGVYTCRQELYEMLRDVCNEKKVPMRAPTMLAFYYDGDRQCKQGEDCFEDLKDWHMEKTKMPKAHEYLGISVAANKVYNWMVHELEHEFNRDRPNAKVRPTEFFIEHFYLQGTVGKLERIIELIKANPSKREHSYEMVVHPVWYNNEDELDSFARGISTKPFEARKQEAITLSQVPLRETLKAENIDRFNYSG